MTTTIATAPSASLADIAAKVEAGQRLSYDDGVRLYASRDLFEIGRLANLVREQVTPNRVGGHSPHSGDLVRMEFHRGQPDSLGPVRCGPLGSPACEQGGAHVGEQRTLSTTGQQKGERVFDRLAPSNLESLLRKYSTLGVRKGDHEVNVAVVRKRIDPAHAPMSTLEIEDTGVESQANGTHINCRVIDIYEWLLDWSLEVTDSGD